MNRKLILTALFCFFVSLAGKSFGQCDSGRYVSKIFAHYTKSTVQYSSAYHLSMDIYQPTGDTLPKRPLIILAHGGSFVQGNRSDDSTVIWLCRNFAQRGYVTASIDYRLDSNFTDMLNANLAIDEVAKAMSDGKAAIRFFHDSTNSSIYRVDTNNIFIGGNSAGAVMYMHVGYLDSLQECSSDIATAISNNGGFEGNSGYPGHSTKAKGIINLAGALHTTAFVGTGDLPSVNAQGDADNVVPFNCGYPNIGFSIPVTLCGLGQLEAAYDSAHIYHMSYVFSAASHVPWASIPSDFVTVDSLVNQFLYSLVCLSPTTEVPTVARATETILYPNPATDLLKVHSEAAMESVEVFDNTGRLSLTESANGSTRIELQTGRLTAGMYFVKIRYTDRNITPVVRKVVIE